MVDRTILHIDMDAFFASVEQRDRPELLNRAVAVVGAGRRTVLVSPSYEARAFGVKTGMTKPQARALCPEIIYITAHAEKYTATCSEIIKILYDFTPDIEVFSIDEFFLDITTTMHLFGSARDIATNIRKKIKQGLSLTCSVGISYNKLLAKFSSKRAKPDGISMLKREEVSAVLDELEPDQLCGIGQKTKQTLREMGIYNLGQLRNCKISLLRKKFGINATNLHLMAKGIDEDPVSTAEEEEDAKTIGHSMTLDHDITQVSEIQKHLLLLSDKVCRRLRASQLSAGCVKLTIRYRDFTTFTKQKSMLSATNDTKQIYKVAIAILKTIRLKQPLRLIGIGTSKLTAQGSPNFLFEETERAYRLNKLLDDVNERFGDETVSFASLLTEDNPETVISPAWRPYGTRRYK